MYLFYSQSGRSRFQLTVDQGIPSRRFTIGDIPQHVWVLGPICYTALIAI